LAGNAARQGLLIAVSYIVLNCVKRSKFQPGAPHNLNPSLGSGPMRGVPSRYIVPGSDSYGGAWDRRTGPQPV